MRILHLNLCYKYWDEIKAGNKPFEYRLVKDYWVKRLAKDYDEVWFHRGYSKVSEETVIKAKWFGMPAIITRQHEHFGSEPVQVFAIPTG